MSWRRRAFATALVCGLSACAALPPASSPAKDSEVLARPLAGRMTVRIDALVNTAESAAGRIVSAAFELSGNAQLGQLDLNTPLGTTLARASWQPGNVAVSTPQGAATYPDLNAMTRALLGEELPLAALFDWLRGRPWPGAPVAAGSSSAEFAQLGWDVSLTQFSQGWVNARRAATNTNTNQPGVTVRVKLDAP